MSRRPPRSSGGKEPARPREQLQGLLFPQAGSQEGPIGYTTRLLVATTLPHSRSDDNEFIRSSGLYDLCLLTPRRVGLPFGRYPRLVWVWVITEAVRRRSPLLYLPRTFSEFANQLGITPSSGAKGTLVHLREQLHRLVNVTFSCLGNAPAEANLSLSQAFFEGGGIHPVKRYRLWWDEPSPDSSPNFHGHSSRGGKTSWLGWRKCLILRGTMYPICGSSDETMGPEFLLYMPSVHPQDDQAV